MINGENGHQVNGGPPVILAEVKSSRHPDILEGTIGIITDMSEGGYGVLLMGDWLIAGSDRGTTIREARIMWYPPEELKIFRGHRAHANLMMKKP